MPLANQAMHVLSVLNFEVLKWVIKRGFGEPEQTMIRVMSSVCSI